MGGDGLGVLDRAAVFEVRGDAGGPEGVAAGGGGEAGVQATAFDHAEYVNPGHGLERKPAIFVYASKQGAFLLAPDAGGFKVGVDVGFGVVVGWGPGRWS